MADNITTAIDEITVALGGEAASDNATQAIDALAATLGGTDGPSDNATEAITKAGAALIAALAETNAQEVEEQAQA